MNMFQWLLMFVPLVLFITVLGPMWLRMHYQHKSRLGQNERQQLLQLLSSLDTLDQRINTLETLVQAPEADSGRRQK